MRRTLLLAAAFLFCGAPVRAQAQAAKSLADFDRLVSQLKTTNLVGEPVRSGETIVIPFAAIRFSLGAGGASTVFGGGMDAKTVPLGVLVVEGDDARAELFPVEDPKPSPLQATLQQVLQAILDRKVVVMGNGVNLGSATGKVEDLSSAVSALAAVTGQTTIIGNAVNFGSLKAPQGAAAPPTASLEDLRKLFAGQKYQKALAAADSLLAANPNDAALHVWRGRILGILAQGDSAAMVKYGPGAMQEFEKALALDPRNADAHYLRGMGRMKAPEGFGRDLDGAIADFEAAAAKEPSPDAYFQLGEALRAKGLNSRAAAAYKKALDLKPEDARASKGLAELSGESR